MKMIQWITKKYDNSSLYDKRKAEYSVGFVFILLLSTALLTINKFIYEVVSSLELYISIINLFIFVIILVMLYYRKLLFAIWVLNTLGVIRILSVLMLYDLVHYYVLVPLILIANGFIHVRKSQYHFVNGSIIVISCYNLVSEWGKYLKGEAMYEVAIISLVSLFYVFAIIYMISKFAQNTDKEIIMTHKLESLAIRDQLTDAFNRRRLDTKLDTDLQNGTNAVLIYDFDHFKLVNDHYGHVVGDKVLSETVQLIQNIIRTEDLIIRFGGEEFVVILRNCVDNELSKVAEKIRNVVDHHTFEDLINHSVTISIGGTIINPDEGIYEAIERADKALYKAKENGRNSVVVI